MLDVAGANVMLDAFAGAAAMLSLHTRDPEDPEAEEIARKPVTWKPAADRVVATAVKVSFRVPELTTVGGYALWTEQGARLRTRPIQPAEFFQRAGIFELDVYETLDEDRLYG